MIFSTHNHLCLNLFLSMTKWLFLKHFLILLNLHLLLLFIINTIQPIPLHPKPKPPNLSQIITQHSLTISSYTSYTKVYFVPQQNIPISYQILIHTLKYTHTISKYTHTLLPKYTKTHTRLPIKSLTHLLHSYTHYISNNYIPTHS